MLVADTRQKRGRTEYYVRPMKISSQNVFWAAYGARIGQSGVEAQTRLLIPPKHLNKVLKAAKVHFKAIGGRERNNHAPAEAQALSRAGFVPVELSDKKKYQETVQRGKPIVLYPGNGQGQPSRHPAVYVVVPLEMPESNAPFIIEKAHRRSSQVHTLIVGQSTTAINQEAVSRFILVRLKRLHNDNRVRLIDIFVAPSQGARYAHWMAGKFRPRHYKRVEVKENSDDWEKEIVQVIRQATQPVLVDAVFGQWREGFWTAPIKF
jgi:hypothetical protein